MRADVRDAIESARSGRGGGQRRLKFTQRAEVQRDYFSFAEAVAFALTMVRELPDEMSMRELREELEDQ